MLFFHCSLHWLKVVGQICQHANFLNTTKQNLKEPSKVKTAVCVYQSSHLKHNQVFQFPKLIDLGN